MAWVLKMDDASIESGLVHDFDASLSGIGQELGAGAYSMRLEMESTTCQPQLPNTAVGRLFFLRERTTHTCACMCVCVCVCVIPFVLSVMVSLCFGIWSRRFRVPSIRDKD